MNHYLRKLRHILRSRYLFKILFLLCLIYIFIFIKIDNNESIININDSEFTGIVTNYKYQNNKYTIYLKNKETIIVNYEIDTKLDIEYGDILNITGTFYKPYNNTISNLFNYKKYLERKRIYYILNADSLQKIKSNENIIYDIKNFLIELIKSKSLHHIF